MFPKLETYRLILRPWLETDADTLYKYAKDPAVGPIAGWPPHTSVEDSLEIIRTVFAAPETYAVVLKDTGEPVGSAGIMFGDGMHSAEMKDGEAEIGYWIGVPYWGQGLIPEAVCCLLHRCFAILGISAVWCGYYDGNIQSKRVMEKCGLTYHHSVTGSISPLGDIRTEHFMRITFDEWKLLNTIREIIRQERTDTLIFRLINLWKSSVSTSHYFLTDADICNITPWVESALHNIELLLVAFDDDTPIGFMGLQERKIEMLFLAPCFMGKGLGRQFIHLAVNKYKAAYVDVNEQNCKAEGFYRHLGFETFCRDNTDALGNPFPILHMKLKNNK